MPRLWRSCATLRQDGRRNSSDEAKLAEPTGAPATKMTHRSPHIYPTVLHSVLTRNLVGSYSGAAWRRIRIRLRRFEYQFPGILFLDVLRQSGE
jgi:AAA+ superfamily predicted ATPase